MNMGAEDGAMPAKVLLSVRAIKKKVGAADPCADGKWHRSFAASAHATLDDE